MEDDKEYSLDLEKDKQENIKIKKLDLIVAGVNIEELTKDLKTARIISPAYASSKSELGAILLYTFQYFQFSYQKREDIAKKLEEISIQEMTHMEWLGQMLIRLGVSPIFSKFPPLPLNFYNARTVPYVTNPILMIKTAIAGEQFAIKDYNNMIKLLDNKIVKTVLQEIVRQEEEHVIILTEILNELQGAK